MSSLDVPTNSVAQVAAAIEEKRNPASIRDSGKQKANSNSMASSTGASGATVSDAAIARGSPQRRVGRKASQNLQGRAFAAPRAASIERSRAQHQDLQDLGVALDKSPRKFQGYRRAPSRAGTINAIPPPPVLGPSGDGQFGYPSTMSNRKGQVVRDEDANELRNQLSSENDTTRSFSVKHPPAQRVPEHRDPPRSASAMGYYMPGDDSRAQNKENRRPSMDKRPSMDRRPSTDTASRANAHPPRRSGETARPKMREWRDGGRSPVGGVQLAGVPEAPKRSGKGEQKKPQWSAQERERWRPHWL